jgi:hypothetical protein
VIPMLTIALLVIVVTPLLIVFLAPLRRLLGHAENPNAEAYPWRPGTAEIVSVLRAGNRTFLLVRYRAGNRIIHNDVLYPLAGKVPDIGQRVPIKYDPSAPARVEFDKDRATAPHGLAA